MKKLIVAVALSLFVVGPAVFAATSQSSKSIVKKSDHSKADKKASQKPKKTQKHRKSADTKAPSIH